MAELAVADLPEAERIYTAIQQEIKTLQSLNAQLLKRICAVHTRTRTGTCLHPSNTNILHLAPRGAAR